MKGGSREDFFKFDYGLFGCYCRFVELDIVGRGLGIRISVGSVGS